MGKLEETKRIRLRNWTNDDHQVISTFFANEDETRFIGGPLDSEASWRLLTSYVGHYALQGYSYWGIEVKETKQLAGAVGIWNSPDWPEPELGYWLLPEARGRGLATEAAQLALDYAKKLNLPSLVSYIDPANAPSIRLAINLGAQPDGTIELLTYGLHTVYRHW